MNTTSSAGPGGAGPGGTLSVLAGAIGQAGDVDGPKGTSRLPDVGGMAFIAPNLYIADRRHAIRKVDVGSGVTTTAVDDFGNPPKLFQPITLAGGEGNWLYGIAGIKTMTNGVVGQVFRYQVVSGVTDSEVTPDAYLGVPYNIIDPVPLAVEAPGQVLVGDNLRVTLSPPDLSGLGIKAAWGISSTLTAWVPADGGMYSVHSYPSVVLKTDLDTMIWEPVAGDLFDTVSGAVDGPKGSARFSTRVGGAAHDGDGHLFVADTNANAIRKVDIATGSITTVIGELSPAGSIVTGDLKNARLHHPVWVAWLGGGKLAIGCPEDFVVLIADGL